MTTDIRWKQRYASFSKAFGQLTEFIEIESLNKFELQGLMQCFEYTFELAWKTMRDYLQYEGFNVRSPRKTIQTGFQIGLLPEGHTWIDALEKRNLIAHTYNEDLVKEAEKLIRNRYYGVIKDLYERLGSLL